ncbi:hypothetical protein A2U01_0118692, partial [Trifolium medium]|nr:hypothetical protein [Trifolium medium]
EASCEGYREQHKTLASNLKKVEEQMTTLTEERNGALKEVGDLKAKIVGGDEKEVDPDGEYAASSRA